MKIIQHADGNQTVEATPDELAKMETLLDTSDKLTPEARAQMLRLLGDAHFTAGDRRTAVEWYAQFVAMAPQVSQGFMDRLESLVREFPDISREGAASVLGERFLTQARAESANPDAEADYEEGVGHAEDGDWPEAVTCFERALARSPDHYWAAHNLGVAYAELGDDAHALMWLERAVGIDPDVPSAYYNLGLLYLKTDNAGRALTVLEKCATLDPTYPGVDTLLGEAALVAGDATRAHAALSRAIKRRQADGRTFLKLGQACEALGMLEDAARAYQHALDFDPAMREARQLLKSVQGRLH